MKSDIKRPDPNIRSDCYELCVGAVNKKLERGS
jgi:hypothetical protein